MNTIAEYLLYIQEQSNKDILYHGSPIQSIYITKNKIPIYHLGA